MTSTFSAFGATGIVQTKKAGTVYWVKEKKESDPLKISRSKRTTNLKQWKITNTYSGEWKGNLKHGYGVQTWSNGKRYEGDWKEGFQDGHGVLWVKDGDKERRLYEGNWAHGLKHGKGVYHSTTQGTYEGEWKNGVREGRGVLFHPNGDVYTGEFKNDKPGGRGILLKANQDIYQGLWLNGKREGAGFHYFRSKEMVFDGEWVNDIPKCGVYVEAADFFEHNANVSDDILQTHGLVPQRRRHPLPELELKNPEEVLAKQILQIQLDRSAARNLQDTNLEEVYDSKTLDELRQRFSVADTEGNGKIDALQLRSLLTDSPTPVSSSSSSSSTSSLSDTQRSTTSLLPATPLSDLQFAQLLRDLGKNANDTVTFTEFVQALHLLRAATLRTDASAWMGSTTTTGTAAQHTRSSSNGSGSGSTGSEGEGEDATARTEDADTNTEATESSLTPSSSSSSSVVSSSLASSSLSSFSSTAVAAAHASSSPSTLPAPAPVPASTSPRVPLSSDSTSSLREEDEEELEKRRLSDSKEERTDTAAVS